MAMAFLETKSDAHAPFRLASNGISSVMMWRPEKYLSQHCVAFV
jgi:hypothetical protein